MVEVCHGWFNRFRKLLVCYEKLEHSVVALIHLAVAIIAFRKAPLGVNFILRMDPQPGQRATPRQPLTPPRFAISGRSTLSARAAIAASKLARPTRFSPATTAVPACAASWRHASTGT